MIPHSLITISLWTLGFKFDEFRINYKFSKKDRVVIKFDNLITISRVSLFFFLFFKKGKKIKLKKNMD